jgi:hypothetical protein
MATPRVVVAAPDLGRSAELRAALEADGFAAVHHSLDALTPIDYSDICAIVVNAVGHEPAASSFCRRCSSRRDAPPILWLPGERADGPGIGLSSGADATLGPRAPTDLVVAQVRALVRGRERTAQLHRGADEARQINDRLRLAYERIDTDAELLRRVRRAFLPRSLPEVAGVRFAVGRRSTGANPSGFYDVTRLDEDHVAFSMADVMGGAGSTNTLLALFVKACVRGKDIDGRHYRMVPPGEVLRRLNRDLIELALPEPPFVAMAYGLLNCRDGRLSLARAAHLPILHVPREGMPTFLHPAGSFLGVADGAFMTEERQLAPGDQLLLATAGADDERLAAAAHRHRRLGVGAMVDQVARDLSEGGDRPDDLSLLGAAFERR